MTLDERKADSIAKALVNALTRLEKSPSDPELIFDAALILSWNAPEGVKHAIAVLRSYYLEE